MQTKTTMSMCRTLTFLCAAAASHPAAALTIPKVTTQTGTASCAPALPAYEGVIRKRPLAIQNEGSTSSFVSCSLTTTLVYATSGSSRTAYLGLTNATGSSTSVTCTLVDAISGQGTPVYIAKTATVPANGFREIQWNAQNDNANVPFKFSPNISCNLNPGIGITYTASLSYDEVGN